MKEKESVYFLSYNTVSFKNTLIVASISQASFCERYTVFFYFNIIFKWDDSI